MLSSFYQTQLDHCLLFTTLKPILTSLVLDKSMTPLLAGRKNRVFFFLWPPESCSLELPATGVDWAANWCSRNRFLKLEKYRNRGTGCLKLALNHSNTTLYVIFRVGAYTIKIVLPPRPQRNLSLIKKEKMYKGDKTLFVKSAQKIHYVPALKNTL